MRWALFWEWVQNRVFIYRKRSANKSNSELQFAAVKLGFHLLSLTITERYSYSAQSTMKSHLSVKSSVMNNVMDNGKLLKWTLKFQFFQYLSIYLYLYISIYISISIYLYLYLYLYIYIYIYIFYIYIFYLYIYILLFLYIVLFL